MRDSRQLAEVLEYVAQQRHSRVVRNEPVASFFDVAARSPGTFNPSSEGSIRPVLAVSRRIEADQRLPARNAVPQPDQLLERRDNYN